MGSIRKNRAIFLLLILVLSSCSFMTSTESLNLSQTTWVKDWLDQLNQNCRIPCFQDISPGKTNVQIAMTTIKENKNIQQVSKIVFDSITQRKEFEWDYIDSGGGILWSGKETDVVEKIRIGFSKSSETKYGLKISDVITKFGSPTHILINECRFNTCSVVAIYMESGMVLEFLSEGKYMANGKGKVKISSDQKIDTITFFSAGQENFNNVIANGLKDVISSLIPWKGFGQYP
jgi:hypothetical protein